MEIKFTNPGVKKRQGSFSGSSADSGQVIEFTQQAAAVLDTLLSCTIQVCKVYVAAELRFNALPVDKRRFSVGHFHSNTQMQQAPANGRLLCNREEVVKMKLS